MNFKTKSQNPVTSQNYDVWVTLINMVTGLSGFTSIYTLNFYFKRFAVIGCLSSTIDDDELDTAGMTSMRVGLGLTIELQ